MFSVLPVRTSGLHSPGKSLGLVLELEKRGAAIAQAANRLQKIWNLKTATDIHILQVFKDRNIAEPSKGKYNVSIPESDPEFVELQREVFLRAKKHF